MEFRFGCSTTKFFRIGSPMGDGSLGKCHSERSNIIFFFTGNKYIFEIKQYQHQHNMKRHNIYEQ